MGVVTCTCNSATSEETFWKGVGSFPVRAGNNKYRFEQTLAKVLKFLKKLRQLYFSLQLQLHYSRIPRFIITSQNLTN